MSSAVAQSTLDRAFEKLGFSKLPENNAQGLKDFYRAWCLTASFDNIRKMIAMYGKSEGPLPGIDAEDFLNAWIEHGVGGTCWPITNALYTLLKAAGFDAIRATGSMWDMGIDNHGTVGVRIDGKDWLVDASMLTMQPLPLVRGEVFISSDPLYKAEVDPDGDGFFVWSVHPPLPHLLPCRLLERDVPYEQFAANYERARGDISPFNAKLYARRAFADHIRVLTGNRLFEVKASPPSEGEMSTQSTERAQAMKMTKLTGDQLLAEMRGPFGYSAAIVDEWERSGAFDATMTPTPPPPKPELTRTPPSQR